MQLLHQCSLSTLSDAFKINPNSGNALEYGIGQCEPHLAAVAFSWCSGMERKGKKGFLEKGPL